MDELEQLENEIQASTIEILNYSYFIREDLSDRLNKHIKLLKRLEDHTLSKQRWITQALREKLSLENIEKEEQETAHYKQLNFRIEKTLSEKIDKRIQTLKKSQHNFSKKQWIIEAISKKLEIEEQKAKKLLEQMTKSFQPKD